MAQMLESALILLKPQADWELRGWPVSVPGTGWGVLSSSELHGQGCPLSGEELRPEEKRARVLGAEPTGAGSGAPARGSWHLIHGRSSPGVRWADLLGRAESSWGPGLRKQPSWDFRCGWPLEARAHVVLPLVVLPPPWEGRGPARGGDEPGAWRPGSGARCGEVRWEEVSGGAAKQKPGAVPSGDRWAQHGGLPKEVEAGPHPSAPAPQQWRVLGAQ